MGFIKRSVQGYGQVIGGFFARRDAVIGILISLLAMGVLVVMLVVLDHTNSVAGSRIGLTVVALVAFASLIAIFATWLSRDNGAAAHAMSLKRVGEKDGGWTIGGISYS